VRPPGIMEADIPDVAVATAIRSISEWCDGDSKKRQLFHWDYLHRLKIGKGRERDERGGEDMFAGLL